MQVIETRTELKHLLVRDPHPVVALLVIDGFSPGLVSHATAAATPIPSMLAAATPIPTVCRRGTTGIIRHLARCRLYPMLFDRMRLAHDGRVSMLAAVGDPVTTTERDGRKHVL
jgi:hypothetical protein